MSRMKWVAMIAVAVPGALWASAKGDDCDGGHRVGFWRGRPVESYSYRSSEPGGYIDSESGAINQQAEYRSNGAAQFDESGRATEMPGLRTRPIRSTSIRLAEGNDVGRIEELVLSESGCIDYMVVSFTNLPRVGDRLAAIPWSAGQFDSRMHVVTLDIGRDALFDAPIFFARGTWPDLYGSEWVARVHSHFGLDSTRIERAYGPRDGKTDRDEMKGRPRGEDMKARPRGDDLKPRPQDDLNSRPRNDFDSRDRLNQRAPEPRGALPEGRPAPGVRDTKPEAAPDRDALLPAPERNERRSSIPKPDEKNDRPLPEDKELK